MPTPSSIFTKRSIVLLFLCGIGIALAPLSAVPLVHAEDLSVTANVGGINPGPIVTGGSGSVPQQAQQPTITIQAEPRGQVPQRQMTYNNQSVTGYDFASGRVVFSGTTSESSGLIFISVLGPHSFNSTAVASSQGYWHWSSPEILGSGSYLITAKVYSGSDFSKSASVSAYFLTQPNEGEPIPDPSGPAGPPPGGGDLVFGVFFEVLPEYKTVVAGEQIVGAISLVSNFTEREIQNQTIEYEVRDPKGQVVMKSDDTVSFNKQARFLKTFFTAPGSVTGVYTIVVKSAFEGVTSTASDTFTLGIDQPTSAAGVLQWVSAQPLAWAFLLALLTLVSLLVSLAYFGVHLLKHIKDHNDHFHS